MFFRPAQKNEFSSSIDFNIFILESHQGILGKVRLDNYNIYFLEIDEPYFLIFLEMIEEYLFMKYNTISIIQIQDSLQVPNDWIKKDSIYTKERKPFVNKQYTMIVQGTPYDQS